MKFFDKTELKIGEIYTDAQDDRVLIFKVIRVPEGDGRCLISDFIGTTGTFNKERDHTTCSVGNMYFRFPTDEERHWLEVCIQENRAVTLKELKSIPLKALYEIF